MEKPREIQVAILKNCLGDDAMKIYQGMQFDNPETERTVNDILQSLGEYSVGILNETYERFAFRHRKQDEGRPLASSTMI